MEIECLLEDLEEISTAYAKTFDIDRTPEWFLMKLTEEVGELTQSYLKFAGQARAGEASQAELRQNMEDELADVIGMALLVAKNQDVDLETAFKRKWLKHLESPRSTS